MRSANLSAVLSNYNHARYLPRALEAILQQSVRPKELIVIDDGSTDDSVAVLDDFARRDPIVRVVRNERNVGVCEAITRGTRLATGEYLLIAAADDYVLPGLIEKSLDMLNRYPAAGMTCAYHSTVDGQTGVISPNPSGWCDVPAYLSPVDLAARIDYGSIPSTSAVYRRASFDRAGGYLTDLRWSSDWFLNLVIGFRDGICHLPETLALITVQPTSYSIQGLRDGQALLAVLGALLRYLRSPAYQDVVPFFQHSGVMSRFFTDLLRIAATSTPGETGEPEPALRAAAALFLAPLCDRAVRLREAELKDCREQLVGAREETARLRQQLAASRDELAGLWQQFAVVQRQLADAHALIDRMRATKFWKLRNVAIRCKNALPLPRRRTA
jgi:hypothetical protein